MSATEYREVMSAIIDFETAAISYGMTGSDKHLSELGISRRHVYDLLDTIAFEKGA